MNRRHFLCLAAAAAALPSRPRSARAQAAGELAATRQALACLGDAVITTDLHGRVSGLNAVAELMTGWASWEAVGRPLESVFRLLYLSW